MQTHGYSLIELETMIPWEREIYISMLADEIKTKRAEAAANQFQ